MTRSRWFFGLALIAYGCLLLLDHVGLLRAGPIVTTWWPLFVVLAGSGQLVTRPRNIVGGWLLVVVGAALLLRNLGVVDSLGLLWPLLLVGLGLWFLARPTRVTAAGSADLDSIVAFGDRRERLPPGAFAGASIVTVFGDVSLDLRATTIEERATMDLVTVFGDVELYVPADWRVTVSGPEIFGDVEVTGTPDGVTATVELHLDVVTAFGDVEVHHDTAAQVPPTPAPEAPTRTAGS